MCAHEFSSLTRLLALVQITSTILELLVRNIASHSLSTREGNRPLRISETFESCDCSLRVVAIFIPGCAFAGEEIRTRRGSHIQVERLIALRTEVE